MYAQEYKGSNVVMILKFSQPKSPNYLGLEDKIAYEEERAWVANDLIEYAAREGKYEDKAKTFEEKLAIRPEKGTYIDYVARRGTFADKGEKGQGEVGTGIFGKNGAIEGAERDRVAKVFRTTGGNIWHGIVSPSREVGDKLFDNKEKAMDFAKSCMSRFIASTHLKYDNVEWYCGWHDDSLSGIKHIQFAFCEKEKHLNSKGQKVYTTKGTINKKAILKSMLNFEEYFSGHRNDVHLARDDLIKHFKSLDLKNIKNDICLDLINLSNDLPSVKGRIGYRSPDLETFRERIDKLANRLIKDIPNLNKSYQSLIDRIGEREERFKSLGNKLSDESIIAKNISDLKQDIKERIGNSIINVASRMKSEKHNEEFLRLKQSQLNFVAQTKAETELRRKKQSERRKDLKRLRRIFSMWWNDVSSPDYVAEFYRDIKKYKQENSNENENEGDDDK